MNPFFAVIDFAMGLWILVSLCLPGWNFIKGIAIPLLGLDTLILLVSHYPRTRDNIITILGWFWR